MNQYDVWLVSLDPTIGYEVKKTRPCLVISPDVMNKYLATIIIAPMTTKSHPYPTRVALHFSGKDGFAILDQIRTVDKQRLVKHLGVISQNEIVNVKRIIQEMLVD